MKAFIIAGNEFSMLARSPVVVGFVVLMLVLGLINAAGYSSMVSEDYYDHSGDLMVGVSNFFWNFSMLFAFLAMCVGVLSVANERYGGSLGVLFAKPVYRRDVIIGKFVGISMLLFVLITLILALFVSLMMLVYVGRADIVGVVARMLLFAVVLFLNCCFTLGLVMCLGIVLSKPEALIVSMAFVAFEWLTNIGSLPASLGKLNLINPAYLYVYAMDGASGRLFNDSLPLGTWLSGSSPYIVLMLMEVTIIMLVNCLLFNREEA